MAGHQQRRRPGCGCLSWRPRGARPRLTAYYRGIGASTTSLARPTRRPSLIVTPWKPPLPERVQRRPGSRPPLGRTGGAACGPQFQPRFPDRVGTNPWLETESCGSAPRAGVGADHCVCALTTEAGDQCSFPRHKQRCGRSRGGTKPRDSPGPALSVYSEDMVALIGFSPPASREPSLSTFLLWLGRRILDVALASAQWSGAGSDRQPR